MALIRAYILVFIAGWILWLWLDKADPVGQAGAPPPFGGVVQAPAYPGYPGGAGLQSPPPPPGEGDLIREFQYGVDLIKRGEYQQSFVFLWRREHWILAGVISILIAFLMPALGRRVSGWRRRADHRRDGP
jgi:hypothetical protein